MDVLISGASVAGPVTAYWLRRNQYAVTGPATLAPEIKTSIALS